MQTEYGEAAGAVMTAASSVLPGNSSAVFHSISPLVPPLPRSALGFQYTHLKYVGGKGNSSGLPTEIALDPMKGTLRVGRDDTKFSQLILDIRPHPSRGTHTRRAQAAEGYAEQRCP